MLGLFCCPFFVWFLCEASVSYTDKWDRVYEWEQDSSEVMHVLSSAENAYE